jgi:hypothetical protein
VVSEIAMVPDRECNIPTLIVLLCPSACTLLANNIANAVIDKFFKILDNITVPFIVFSYEKMVCIFGIKS